MVVFSTEKNPVVTARCAKLQVECIQGCADKTQELKRALSQKGIPAFNVIFVGNDVNDIGCLRLAGCGFAVADAHPMLKQVADGVLSHPGGHGAVRELAEMILVKLGREIIYSPSDRES